MPPRKKAADDQGLKDKVLDAALKLFAERGIDGTEQ